MIRNVFGFICMALFTTTEIFGSIICPADISITCDSDLDDTDLTGLPQLFGNHANYTPLYTDQDFTNSCEVGLVVRKWYIDENYNQMLDAGELFCTQNITLEDIVMPISFNVPRDVTINCLDNIPSSTVTWTAGPCDFFGYSSEDIVFEISGASCQKILRRHTIIDWCEYKPQDPDWDGEGLYEFDQFIKVIDDEAPEIVRCAPLKYPVNGDCTAEVTLTNAAIDLGDCPSPDLSWEVDIDLWADGTVDYTFGFLQSGKFYLAPTVNDESVQILIPEALSPGNHKVEWRVRDECGNWSYCKTTFQTVDDKAPTPYCDQIIFGSFDGSMDMEFPITAESFDRGATDNCTPSELLRFSYSSDVNNDTMIISCTNQGFKFLNIYATDLAGNQDFCQVFLLIFDRGLCGTRIGLTGTVRDFHQRPMASVEISASRPGEELGKWSSNEEGEWYLNDLPAYDDIVFSYDHHHAPKGSVDVSDYFLLMNHLLGKQSLSSPITLAADLDENKRITPNDLALMRDYLLGKLAKFPSKQMLFYSRDEADQFRLRTHKTDLPILDFKGKFDLIGLKKGDLNPDETEGRTKDVLYLEAMRKSSGEWIVVFPSEFSFQAMQLTLESSEVGSLDFKDLNVEDSHMHRPSSSVVHFLIDQPHRLSEGAALFEIKSNELPMLLGKLINDEGQKVEVRLRQPNSKVAAFYPNPANQALFLGENDVVCSRLTDVLGRDWPIRQTDDQILLDGLPGGTYLLHFSSGGENRTYRFIVVE